MRKLILPILLRCVVLAVVLLAVSACESVSDEEKLIRSMANNYIIPIHEDFVSSTAELTQVAQQYCTARTEENLEQLQNSWRKSIQVWQGVQMVHFGPLVEQNLAWRIQFYYDRKNLVAKKVEAALKSGETINREFVSQSSVPMQGFPAIEYLLFDEKGADPSRYDADPSRCVLLVSIAENLNSISMELLDNWQQSYLGYFLNPGPENEHYASLDEAMTVYIGALSAKVYELTKKKYRPIFGRQLKTPRVNPYKLESWRSGYTLGVWEAQIDAMESVYRGGNGGYGLDKYLKARPEHRELHKQLEQDFIKIRESFANSPAPLFTAVNAPEHKVFFEQQDEQLWAFTVSLGHDLPEALGIKLGFNANDGD